MKTVASVNLTLGDVREDAVIKRAFQIKEAADEALNLERIEQEAALLHTARTSRKLYKIALEPSSLAEAAMRDMSNRARLSELKTRVYVQRSAIENAYEQCSAHVATKYSTLIRKYATNAADRKLVLNKILRPLVSATAEMDSTLNLLEIYIKDIDAAAWALRNATEMLKLLMDNRGKAV